MSFWAFVACSRVEFSFTLSSLSSTIRDKNNGDDNKDDFTSGTSHKFRTAVNYTPHKTQRDGEVYCVN